MKTMSAAVMAAWWNIRRQSKIVGPSDAADDFGEVRCEREIARGPLDSHFLAGADQSFGPDLRGGSGLDHFG